MTLATARRIAIDGPPKATTLKAVCEDWIDREGSGIRRLAERKSVFNRLVYPELGDRPIEEIKRSEIVAMLDGIAKKNGPVMADRT